MLAKPPSFQVGGFSFAQLEGRAARQESEMDGSIPVKKAQADVSKWRAQTRAVRGVRRRLDQLARAAADVVSDRAGRPRRGKA